MTMDGKPPGGKWDRASLLRALTCAQAQLFASAGTGLLVWADVISIKVPLYFFNEAALVVKEAVSFVALQAADTISNIFDRIEHNNFSATDTARIAATSGVIYLGFIFFKRSFRALKTISPIHWPLWPRFNSRRKLFLISVLAAGVFAAWQFGILPQLGSQFLALANQIVSRLSPQDLSYVSQWLWHGIVAAYDNKETIFPVVKGILAAVATYTTLEVARVTATLVLPAVRLSYAAYNCAYPWLPKIHLSKRQKDCLHAAGSLTGGLIFGFSNLSFSSVPVWAWAALTPGLFLFAKERPNLVSAIWKVGLKLGRCFHAAAEFTIAQPKLVGGITAGFMVGIAAVGALFASSPFLGFGIMSGIIKAAHTGTAIALLIAAGRGSAGCVAHVRQVTSHLTIRASEVRRDMLWVASEITKPILKLGKATLTPTSRSKTETVEREQVGDTMPKHEYDQSASGWSINEAILETNEVKPVPKVLQE
jgi:hypothetical protein